MNDNNGLSLVAPRVVPVLDPEFRPAVLANRAFREQVRKSGKPLPVRIALEQTDGSVYHFLTEIFSEDAPQAAGNYTYIERIVKFLLWSRGGWRIYFDGPASIAAKLTAHYRDEATGKFDSEMVGTRMFDHALEVVNTKDIPPERAQAKPLGRHLDGCRIGFDLGGSDRKAAAVVDGRVVFSEETVWDPYFHPEPQYHFDGIMDSLKKAAAHLPRVDAIGGSAAGVYVNNRVKVASLFRGVPPAAFKSRVTDLFLEIKRAWNNVPLEVVNDGEVTALAGSMALGKNAVLGIALGTSTAGGWVNSEGNITSWLNELAFVPVDYNPKAARDEWSGDYGVGSQYFSQQAVGRLMPAAGIEAPKDMPLPEKLKLVQSLMAQGDERARKIYETIGVYLGYEIAHFADFYDLRNLLILGRVTSGKGGDLIVAGARALLKSEFPELAGKIELHVPDEKMKRHGQAIAAASLPEICPTP
ncbi:MAG: ROK family protein [Verrucomicrobia bacterium]|nr:ROK family protein [Verrucomicrobiota bacterium]